MNKQKEQFEMYLQKYEEYLVGYRRETAIIAKDVLSKTDDMKIFSTREKSLNHVKLINPELNSERLIDVSKILNVIYNELNRTVGYDENTRKLLLKRKMERKSSTQLRSVSYRDYK